MMRYVWFQLFMIHHSMEEIYAYRLRKVEIKEINWAIKVSVIAVIIIILRLEI